MKKIFFLFVLLLPLAGFCSFDYDYNGVTVSVERVRRFAWSSFGVTDKPSNTDTFYPDFEDEIFSFLSSATYGISFRLEKNKTSLESPSPSFTFVRGLPSSSSVSTITNSVHCSTGGIVGATSPIIFPKVRSLYVVPMSLFRNGYRGPGFSGVFRSGDRYCVNVNFPVLVSDVLSSTNTVFHSSLLSSLSDVNGSLALILQSLSDISSRPSSSDVWNYDRLTNFLGSATQLYINGFDFDLAKIRSDINPDNYDLNDPDGVAGWNNAVESYCRGIPLLQSLVGLSSSLSEVDPRYSGISSLGKAFNQDIANALTGGGSGGGGIAGDIKRLSTNDWTKGVRDQLRENTDNITNRLAHMFDDTPNSAGRAIRQTADNTAVSAARASDIASKLNGVLHVQVDNPNNIGVVLDGPVTIDSTQFNGVSVPLSGLKDRIDTWYNGWYSFWDISTPAYSWANFYNMIRDFEDQNHGDLSAITNSLRGVFSVTGDVSRIYDYLSGPQSNLLEVIASSITNNWDEYYFKRFRRANEFSDEDDQPFTLEGASEAVFGRGFDEGEYSKLNWFSRVELLLFQLSAVSSGTNSIESVDIEDDLNDSVDSFNQHGQDFVNASRRVVGVFQLIDGFAASMRAAFGSFSNPVTHGITLLPAGSWIGDHALVLEVSITVQNALRLVFQCIWYLSAFVVAWRVVVSTWSRVVSFVRWLWSVFDI